jgi:predicted TIM-barrel enzyme
MASTTGTKKNPLAFEKFLNGKSLIGMCHLPPVSEGIGAWDYAAKRNIEALASGGIRAVILENDGDKDIITNPGYADNERLSKVRSYMTEVGGRIRKAYPQLFIGYQILWNYPGTIRIAYETEGHFIRSQMYWEHRKTPSEKFLYPACQMIQAFKSEHNSNIAVLADIDSKGTLPFGDYSREKSIEELMNSQYKPQALIFTGNSVTGAIPNLESFMDFHNDVRKHSDVPVGGGRSLSLDNIRMFTDTPAGFWIVGGSLKDSDGYIGARKTMELTYLAKNMMKK